MQAYVPLLYLRGTGTWYFGYACITLCCCASKCCCVCRWGTGIREGVIWKESDITRHGSIAGTLSLSQLSRLILPQFPQPLPLLSVCTCPRPHNMSEQILFAVSHLFECS
jgi:hypothetical protein